MSNVEKDLVKELDIWKLKFAQDNYKQIADIFRTIEKKFSFEPSVLVDTINNSIAEIDDLCSQAESTITTIREEIESLRILIEEYDLFASDLDELTEKYSESFAQPLGR